LEAAVTDCCAARIMVCQALYVATYVATGPAASLQLLHWSASHGS
jgi:hypothetical protein